MNLTRIPLDKLCGPGENFLPLMTVNMGVARFESRLDVQFENGIDDLDYFRGLGLRLSNGSAIALIQYRGQDQNTVTVYRVGRPGRDDVGQLNKPLVDLIKSELGIDDADV